MKQCYLQWKNHHNSRYYTVEYKQDLLGNWVLIKAYGRVGTRLGQVKQIVCKDYREGIVLIEHIDKLRKLHGYSIKT